MKLVPLLLIVLLVVVNGDNNHNNNNNNNNDNDNDFADAFSDVWTLFDTYDYIVVGLGQAGSVVAARLAEAGKTVLALEGGPVTQYELGGKDIVATQLLTIDGKTRPGTHYTRFDVPSFFSSIWTLYPDWSFVRGYPTSRAPSSAKLLGGGGAHNGVLYQRFTKPSVDAWGVTGWSFDEILPWYKKSENFTGSTRAWDTYHHGLTGPIVVSDQPTTAPYSSVPIWIQSCVNTGLPINNDFNGASRTGCGTQSFNIRRGVRESAARAYLPNALKTKKLTISVETEVTKVLLRNVFGKEVAYGVEFTKNGQTKRAYATKEVIVAGGPIQTPKLLMLSGIGEAAQLTSFGIPVRVNSPYVGKQLRNNHLVSGRVSFPTAPQTSLHAAETEYARFGTGPWSHPGHQGYAYGCVNKTSPCTDPDFMAAYLISWGQTTVNTQVETNLARMVGEVRLTSANPTAPVNISVDDWAFQEDVDATVAGLKLLREIFTSAPANTLFGAEVIPGPTVVTDAQLAAHAKATGGAHVHWVGSTKIGNPGDPTAVVSPTLKVNGVEKLRVCDAGILPTANTHTSQSAVLVGERCAGFILGITA